MSDAEAVAPLVQDGRIGLYGHWSALEDMDSDQVRATSEVWDQRGGGLIEIGQFGKTFFVDPGVLWEGHVIHNGWDSRAVCVNLDSFNWTDDSLLNAFNGLTDSAFGVGIALIMPVATPNAPSDTTLYPRFSDPHYENVRRMIRKGGGLVMDVPPLYYFQGADDVENYQQWIKDAIAWCVERDLSVVVLVSPYLSCETMLGDTQRLYRDLEAAGAFPHAWAVENYGKKDFQRACPLEPLSDAQGQLSTALWLAQNAQTSTMPAPGQRAFGWRSP